MAVRCRGITNKDERCKLMVSNSEFCHHHKSQEKNPKHIGLPSKVQTIIKKGPSKNDSNGYIYVYYLARDQNEIGEYWKIGRTTQTVTKRISQWKGAILKASFKVKYNKMAERIIHLMLDKYRVYRYKHNDGYHSIYKKDGSKVRDSQMKHNFKLEAVTKHIEWFICDWKHVKKVITSTIAFVNKQKK